LKTIEGYSVKATQDHKFFEADKGWCELKDLEPNDKIKLANLEDANWEGENTFNDGYLLGFCLVMAIFIIKVISYKLPCLFMIVKNNLFPGCLNVCQTHTNRVV